MYFPYISPSRRVTKAPSSLEYLLSSNDGGGEREEVDDMGLVKNGLFY